MTWSPGCARRWSRPSALLDEIVVIDSDSTDATYDVATDAGAVVHRSAEIRPDLGTLPGKGEAMWKSLFVTTRRRAGLHGRRPADWDTHFVPGLLGPLLTDPAVRWSRASTSAPATTARRLEGGRVTELVARPLIALLFPELAGLVQPLAGEWAVRRVAASSRSRCPPAYAVELAALVDTCARPGLDAIAQVDLGTPRPPAPGAARPRGDGDPDPRRGLGPLQPQPPRRRGAA